MLGQLLKTQIPLALRLTIQIVFKFLLFSYVYLDFFFRSSCSLQDCDALLLGNTNDGVNSNINKMDGFGLSYSVPLNKNTYRFYSQAIGEDEAGNLPSCYAWMTGLELQPLK